MTRASLGVQDFDPKVQQAINREQSFLLTKSVVDAVRARGVNSVNLDLLYGLPHQTLESVARTVAQALTLQPDRLALFGYAHGVGDRDEAEGVDEDRQADDDRAGEQIYDHILIVAAQRRFALCKIKPMEAAFFWGAGQDPALRKYFAVDFTELQSVIC